jgi:hypothetical protein
VVAVCALVAGVIGALAVGFDHNLSKRARVGGVVASLVYGAVTASFLAVFGYLIPVLVAIYDEVRAARGERPAPRAPTPPGGWGYSPPPQHGRGFLESWKRAGESPEGPAS